MADIKGTGTPALEGAIEEISYGSFSEEGWGRGSIRVPYEMALRIRVNQQELGVILCTPIKLDCLVLGLLYSEGIISHLNDVANIKVHQAESLAEVMLSDSKRELPRFQMPGPGASFKAQRIDSALVISPMEILSLMERFQEEMKLYQLCGGVHTSALSDAKDLLAVAEDIGRHNTLNKIQGEILLRGLSTKDRVLLSTARFSSEMLLKAAKMGVPIVVARHPPTGRAVSLARDLGITLVGHSWGNKLSVYSHPERLSYPAGDNHLKAS